MCKDFKIITDSSVISFRSIGEELMIREENGVTQHAISEDRANESYKRFIDKARYVKMSKHLNEVIV